jgi:hypothetical protein
VQNQIFRIYENKRPRISISRLLIARGSLSISGGKNFMVFLLKMSVVILPDQNDQK